LQYPIDRPAYIITGGNTSDMPDTLKVAKALKDLGAHVTIVEYGMKSFPDAVRGKPGKEFEHLSPLRLVSTIITLYNLFQSLDADFHLRI
jgi:hypothetical protein